ncbi:SHOCT domain-containing protein [Nonomuraea sp. NPDC050663]|uniref:SHOCT domain-containing protein n=1 Tax=Nonomuraea sp. NPDC050663 TaxID=3364370 RepID=UPI0037B9A05A
MARTAVITGTATAVSGGMQRRAERRASEQEAMAYQQQQEADARVAAQVQAQQQYQAAQQPAQQAPAGPDRLQQLKDLGQLKADGLLTEEEFAQEKARILAS